jgi:hypothetical protein
MAKNLLIAALIAFSAFFTGCKASYPRGSVAGKVQELIKKEYNIEGRAKLSGETLYLEVNLAGLITTEQKVLAEILKKVQGASLVITRVALSSDATVKYMVLVVSEPTYKLNLRIIQRLDDVKGFLYQKISKSDYEDRLVLEIEKGEEKPGTLESEIEKSNGMEMKEFVGRLIVSQVNMLSRSNPFLGVILGNTQLKYIDFKEDELVVGISNSVSESATPFFKGIINSQALKTSKKYADWGPKRVKLIDNNNNSMLVDVAPKATLKN